MMKLYVFTGDIMLSL